MTRQELLEIKRQMLEENLSYYEKEVLSLSEDVRYYERQARTTKLRIALLTEDLNRIKFDLNEMEGR